MVKLNLGLTCGISFLEVLLENESVFYRISHFRAHPGLCIKTRLRARPLIWKWFFILMQAKLILTRKVVHLASFWKWGFLEFGSGLLHYATVLYRLSLLLLAVTRLHWKRSLNFPLKTVPWCNSTIYRPSLTRDLKMASFLFEAKTSNV